MIHPKKWLRNKTQLGTTVVLIAALLSACTGGTATKGTDGKDKTQGPPTEISIVTEYSTAEPPGPDNPVHKEFEKRTNTKLKIQWESSNNWGEKQNVVLSTGDIPDLMKVNTVGGNPLSGLNNPLMQQMARQGAFWDLTPYLKDYPNLMQYPQEIWEKTKIDGKNYIIPSVRPLSGGSWINIRKDWLDTLNLKVPETMDDLYQVMKAFTNGDPDKNGKADTYGFTMKDYSLITQSILNESNGKWKLQDGNLIDTELEPGTRESLVWLNKMYTDKLIPEDFSVLKTTQQEDLAKGNKAGIQIDTVEGIWRSTEQLRKTIPEADFLPLSTIKGPSGKPISFQTPGFAGLFLIPKKSVSEEKLKKILALMDYGASEEGFELACYGLKDIHFTVKDGFKVTNEQAVKDSVSQSAFGKIFERYDPYLWAYRTGMTKEVFERNKKIVDERMKVMIVDPSIGLTSETNQKLGPDYVKKISDLKVKIIMGKESMDAWDSYVKELKADSNYQKIITEMNASYKASIKA